MSSLWFPLSTTRPSALTRMMSQPWMVERRWAIAKEVRPSRAASKAFCTMASLCVSKALVASSSSITGGFRINARQMATRCFCPPDRRPPRGPTSVSKPLLPFLYKKARLDIFSHFWRYSSLQVSPSSKPYITFARTVVLKSTGSWPTKPICLRHQRMLTVFRGTRSAPMKTLPSCGS
mmetsp:Transcript_4984/g.9050  ORF Transcript_4984/g.9050 Transcript_4984/m.9050 type:complete len:178 (+) Transcript_4984:44-577(+)